MFFYAIYAAALALPKAMGSLTVVGAIVALSAVGLIFMPDFTPLTFWTNPTMMAFAFGVLIARADLAELGPRRGGLPVLVLGLVSLVIFQPNNLFLNCSHNQRPYYSQRKLKSKLE